MCEANEPDNTPGCVLKTVYQSACGCYYRHFSISLSQESVFKILLATIYRAMVILLRSCACAELNGY